MADTNQKVSITKAFHRDLEHAIAGVAFVLISICDVALGRFKYGRDAMREGRFVVWTMLKHAMRIWSV